MPEPFGFYHWHYRLIYNSKASRELFVVFAQHEVRFRNRPGKKVTKIQHQDLRSVKQHNLSAVFHLHNGKQHCLNWENADYDDIQLIKQHLQALNQQLERAGTPAQSAQRTTAGREHP